MPMKLTFHGKHKKLFGRLYKVVNPQEVLLTLEGG